MMNSEEMEGVTTAWALRDTAVKRLQKDKAESEETDVCRSGGRMKKTRIVKIRIKIIKYRMENGKNRKMKETGNYCRK